MQQRKLGKFKRRREGQIEQENDQRKIRNEKKKVDERTEQRIGKMAKIKRRWKNQMK